MSQLDEILAQPTGARFFRADLHIHSLGASHDVKDSAMTAAAIVATAAREGLAIIAVTDHNEIDNVEAALQSAQSSQILMVPAVELSTSHGCPSGDQARSPGPTSRDGEGIVQSRRAVTAH